MFSYCIHETNKIKFSQFNIWFKETMATNSFKKQKSIAMNESEDKHTRYGKRGMQNEIK